MRPGEGETAGPALVVVAAPSVAEQSGSEADGKCVLAHRLGANEKVCLIRHLEFSLQELDHAGISDQIVEHCCHVR
jgi:hypothetical protein